MYNSVAAIRRNKLEKQFRAFILTTFNLFFYLEHIYPL